VLTTPTFTSDDAHGRIHDLRTYQSFTGYDPATQAGTALHEVTHGYDPHRDVLLTKTNTRSSDGATISGIGYTVNTIGQRTHATRSGAATHSTAWGYDALGQVITADDSHNGGDRAYQYDTIGNRTKSAESLTLPATPNYAVNALNQYTALGNRGQCANLDKILRPAILPAWRGVCALSILERITM
jgi:hypothetical protein